MVPYIAISSSLEMGSYIQVPLSLSLKTRLTFRKGFRVTSFSSLSAALLIVESWFQDSTRSVGNPSSVGFSTVTTSLLKNLGYFSRT